MQARARASTAPISSPTRWRCASCARPVSACLSEESGFSEGASEMSLLAVLDPVDGSTNASRRIPWFATSICVLDEDGPLAALVVNQANGSTLRGDPGRRGPARRRADQALS